MFVFHGFVQKYSHSVLTSTEGCRLLRSAPNVGSGYREGIFRPTDHGPEAAKPNRYCPVDGDVPTGGLGVGYGSISVHI